MDSYKALRKIYFDTRQYDKAWCLCATLSFLKKADAEDNALRVKVDDGVVDFRELVSTSQYMVAEGVFQKVGEHGAQVFIMEHGAMVSGSES